MQKWEYKILCYGWDELRKAMYWLDIDQKVDGVYSQIVSKRLKVEGEMGWELVNVEQVEVTKQNSGLRYFFLKRPIKNE